MCRHSCRIFQSTLPRGERPCLPCSLVHGILISIHAPARGATCGFPVISAICFISIHAPARGATSARQLTELFLTISIHAPARGATDQFQERDIALSISIHAPARGATPSPSVFHFCVSRFQSTLPRGERLCGSSEMVTTSNFNPRSREGSDPGQFPQRPELSRFQSTLPRGERRAKDLIQKRNASISIHAPARGATAPSDRI